MQFAMRKIYSASRAFTLIELMVVVMLISILSVSAFQVYDTYINRSKTQEVYLMLPKIARGSAAYYEVNGVWVPLGPSNIPPSPIKTNVDFLADPGWNRVSFSVDAQVYYGYRGYENAGDFVAEAQGDLDGDGDVSIFNLPITVAGPGKTTIGGIVFFDELE